jgi:predicted alpha/beta-fold hydrolase
MEAKMKKALVLVLSLVLLTSLAWADEMPYEYPIVNPYEATVIGTPDFDRPALPAKVPVETLDLTVFGDRKTPDVFWYWDTFRCSLAYQKGKAPLIFIIAGTGADYHSSNMVLLQKIFYKAGFHVINLSSPTAADFIVGASTTQIPGNMGDDTGDLYRVMQLAWNQVKDRIEVSEFYLTGYSLGGAQSAFLAKLDDEKHLFNFKKVLLINPPVSLYNSARILDDMLVENIPGGMEHLNEFFDRMMEKLSRAYKRMGAIDLSGNFLYDIYKFETLDRESMEALIGFSFRLSASNMIFTSDVVTNTGYIKPKNLILTTGDSTTDYAKVCMNTSFLDYFNEMFYPFFRARQPDLSKQALIDGLSLRSIEDYLKNTKKIGLVHNEDDIILAPGEIDFFRQVFGSRAKIYPNGGHCGNMIYIENVDYMINFFKS